MRLQSILRLSVATIAAATAFACSEGSSVTGPRTTSVDARFSHPPGDAGKKAKVATCVARHEDRQSARIGSNGGTLRIGNNTLVVPAGALSAEIEITDTPLTTTLGGDTSPQALARPWLLVGWKQFRDRDLFLSYSTGMICVAQPSR